MCLILALISVTSSSTNLSFLLCLTVHLVTLSVIVPEILGNNEMDAELTGELVIDKLVPEQSLTECGWGQAEKVSVIQSLILQVAQVPRDCPGEE